MSIRSHYEELGVQEYYKTLGDKYKNPHSHLLTAILCDLLSDQTSLISGDLTILDFACGSGEGIRALLNAFKRLGISHSKLLLDVSDPYTLPAFHHQRLVNPLPEYVTLRNEYEWTFEELSHSDSMISNKEYDIVISSFALHCNLPLITLVAESCLFSLLYHLSLHCKTLIVLSPHKNPVIRPSTGWILINKIQKRVHGWLYCSVYKGDLQSVDEFINR